MAFGMLKRKTKLDSVVFYDLGPFSEVPFYRIDTKT